ncbi:hypothetical protein [Flavobacterium sp. 3HN19-14]|uniref:hypothetical protein n=1 Tax=Flavobacterium sp. 3HN19-14 TaxID=3448133 RepID=UPI003EE2A067
MKNNHYSYGKKLLLLCFLMLSYAGFAQVAGTSFTYTLANPSNPSPTTLEFDINLVVNHTGTALADGGVKVANLQYGVNFNPNIMNGGTPSTAANGGSFVLIANTRDAIFDGLNFTGANGVGSYRGTVNNFGQLRVIGTAVNGASSVLIPNGTYRIGRYRFTNTVAWTANSDAQFWINNSAAGASTTPGIIGYKNGTTTPNYPYGLTSPAANPGVSVGYTEASPLSLVLNATEVPVSGVQFMYTLANPSNPTPTTLEFDINLVVNHTGTALADGGIKIASLQYGVNFNPAIMNGGTPSTAANGGSFVLARVPVMPFLMDWIFPELMEVVPTEEP